MITEKVWKAIKAYGMANRLSGPTEIRIARRKLEIEIEIYANEMAIEGLNRAAVNIGNKATETEKGQE